MAARLRWLAGAIGALTLATALVQSLDLQRLGGRREPPPQQRRQWELLSALREENRVLGQLVRADSLLPRIGPRAGLYVVLPPTLHDSLGGAIRAATEREARSIPE